MGTALREGFYKSIETAPITPMKKTEFLSNPSLLNLDCLKLIFSRACSVDPIEFMRAVHFDDSILEQQRTWFATAIHQMTNLERIRLVVFITGKDYFSNAHIRVDLVDRDDEPCIQASTCFSTLHLPPCKSLHSMFRNSITQEWILVIGALRSLSSI